MTHSFPTRRSSDLGPPEAPAAAQSAASLQLAVIIPTLNEVGNIRALLERIEDALSDIRWEAVFVDDNSTDGTPELLREIGRSDHRVRVIQRIGRRGLSSAVRSDEHTSELQSLMRISYAVF